MKDGRVETTRVSRLAAQGAACVLLATLLAGCGGVRNNLGTNASVCYTTLPTASVAIHNSGRLLGVRLVATSSLRGRYALFGATSGDVNSVKKVCLVAYAGTFSKAAVLKGRGYPSGRRAVVAVVYPGNRLLATVVLDKLPMPFNHPHVGV